ncbi:MAG: outer membrane beta-barrel protein [Ferruginibacter sp.]
MKKIERNLSEIVVTARKPLIETRPDKTIINVDASISNNGATAMEILEKSPGITVDKDGNISLRGKPGVMIMLDGKPTYLNGQDLTNLLKSMPAGTIDQIEIMTNPSAKYEASGNSGIINIKTKKNKQKGFNGSINLAYGQGIYAKTNNSITLNYRTGKFNVFSTISGNYRKDFQNIYIQRKYLNPDQSLNAIFQQNSFLPQEQQNYNAKLGVDFYASKKTTFGIVLTGITTPQTTDGINTSYLKDNMNVLDSIVVSTSKEKSKWRNGGINLNYTHEFDSTGRELSANLDYLNYNSEQEQHFSNITYMPDMAPIDSDYLYGQLPSQINIYSAKIDYTHPLKNGIKIESGLKSSYVSTNNVADYFNIVNNINEPDYTKTNTFQYKENINAAYINLNKQIKKWDLQAGLRLENTNYQGHQFGNPQHQDSLFKQSYTSLFPTLFTSYQANKKNQFTFSYGRRINRPDYEDLNPFLFFIDKYTYGSGNPFLKPSFANVLEVSHTYNQFLTTTLNYTYTKDLFTETFQQKDYTTIIQQGNFGTVNNVTLSETAQIPVTKWWTSVVYAEVNYNSYKGLLYGDYVNVDADNFLININNQFTFSKGWSAELSGFYRTKGIEGQILIDPLGELNIGVQKKVLKDKGSVKLNVRDILNTHHVTGNINFQNTEAYFNQNSDNRIITLGFNYRFGKIANAVKRKTGGATDEQNRVKGSN